jgi:Holliday junction DNA helicase RuvB
MDKVLRPESWDDYIGQEKLKSRLDVHIVSAFEQEKPMHSTFLYAPPGYGKTSLATVIASRLTDPIVSITMPIKEQQFVRLLRDFEGGILFLDEIHRAPPWEQEALLTLVDEDYYEDSKGRQTHIGWATIIGATTEREKIIPPLYDRFVIKPEFEKYSEEEMAQILGGIATRLDLKLSEEQFMELGGAATGIPRRARELMLSAKDLQIAYGRPPTTDEILDHCQVDREGLTSEHKTYLRTLDNVGGRAGLTVLSNMTRMSEPTLKEIERVLIERRMIEFTPAGREMTGRGFKVLKGTKVSPRGTGG